MCLVPMDAHTVATLAIRRKSRLNPSASLRSVPAAQPHEHVTNEEHLPGAFYPGHGPRCPAQSSSSAADR